MSPATQRTRLPIDLDAFTADVKALKAELDAARGPEDAAHLHKIRWLSHALWAAGWAFAWIPNPFSPIAIALARSVRWTCVAHHILHKGYDQVPGLPDRETSKGFAQGRRRFVDWPDWLQPAAWQREHNQLHHYRLGEVHDPDVVELNADLIGKLPRPIAMLAVLGIALGWKFLYFAPSNSRELQDLQAGHRLPPIRDPRMDFALLSPLNPAGREVWRTSWIPYALWAFVAMPALFLPLGVGAALTALATSVVAEVLTNIHTFAIVVTNHAGSDVYRFEGKPKSQGEFWLRQVLGSVNFRTGGDINDLLHGWLNYQIEHHVWPDMSMRQYQLAQPKLKAICEKHGVPYLQQSGFKRVAMLWRVMVGDARSPVFELGDAKAETPLPSAANHEAVRAG